MKLIAIVMAAFLIVRAVLPCSFRWYYKILLSLLILFASFKFFIFAWISGSPNIFAPDLPVFVQYIGTGIYCLALIYFTLLLIVEAARLVYSLIVKSLGRKLSNLFRENANRANLILLGVALVLTGTGLVMGMVLPTVKEHTMEIARLPKEADGIKIAILADIHIEKTTSERYVKELVELVNAQKPDIICLLGDMVDGKVEDIGEKVALLKDLKATTVVYGVPGNHEYFSGYDAWMKFFKGLGVKMLINEAELIDGVIFAGITDKAARRYKKPVPDVVRAVGSGGQNHPVILFSHRPEHVAAAAKQKVDLQISGHTHGGIIWGMDILVGMANGGYYSGFYQVDDTRLYVSNGAGIWRGLPVRLGRNSELTVFTLKVPGK
jgi:predicted MPP superfamily phosphohydrolase